MNERYHTIQYVVIEFYPKLHFGYRQGRIVVANGYSYSYRPKIDSTNQIMVFLSQNYSNLILNT